MSRIQQLALRLFPQARGRVALVSLVVTARGLAGGVVTAVLTLFAREGSASRPVC